MGVAYAAGVLLSKVQLESDEVLASGGACGFPGMKMGVSFSDPEFKTLPRIEQMNIQALQSAWGRWIGYRSLEYVRNCYIAEGPVNEGMCNVFTTPSISFSTDNKTSCPFAPELCAQPNAMQVDTGYVDSNDHLGINTVEKDRLRFRKVMSCVPLRPEKKYSSGWVSTPPPDAAQLGMPQNSYQYYYLGGRGLGENVTWVVSKYTLWNVDNTQPAYNIG